MRFPVAPLSVRAFRAALVASAIALLPVGDLHARLANWYPDTPAEQAEQTQHLNEQLQELDQIRESQLADRTKAEEMLSDLLDQLQAAEADLRTHQKPLKEITERYRRVQSIAVVDPMMDAEGQRQEYLRLKRETEASIRDRQERVNWLNQQIKAATQNLADARQKMTVTLSLIDRLWKHREIIGKLVFLRVVND